MRLEGVALALLLGGTVAAQGTPDWLAAMPGERAALRALERVRAAPGAVLAPFETDGCSGGMSSIWRLAGEVLPALAREYGDHPPWERCCVAHDRVYHRGEGGIAGRIAADAGLKVCVADVLEARAVTPQAADAVAQTMFVAVRLGGAPCSGLPWRWGYGWPHCTVLGE